MAVRPVAVAWARNGCISEDNKGGHNVMIPMFQACRFSAVLSAIVWGLTSASPVDAANVVRTNIQTDPVTLEPAAINNWPDRVVAQNIFQGLVQFDYTANPPFPMKPVLAKSYSIEDNGKAIVFELRQGVMFHKGFGELTADDVVFSMERHRDPKLASRARTEYADVEKVEALGKYRVRVVLRSASALTFMGNLAWQDAGFILSKIAYQKFGDGVTRNPVGTGPYYLDRWVRGDRVVLKKFGEYWGKASGIDEIQFIVIPEEVVALGALTRGELDMVAITQLGSYEHARTLQNIKIQHSSAGAGQIVFWVNHTKKPMDDIRVRKALAHALDLKSICDRLGPLVRCFPSPFSSVTLSATDEFWNYDYNPEKAKKLLAEAGYPNGFELKLIYKKLHIFEPVAIEVKRSWDKVVNVKLEATDNAIYYKVQDKLDHHISSDRFTRFVPFQYAQFYESSSSVNYPRYANPKVDEAIRNAITATDEAEASKRWREVQRLLTEDLASFWIVNSSAALALRKDLHDVIVLPMPTIADLTHAAYR